jgi:phthalate 4,5-dioxygenase
MLSPEDNELISQVGPGTVMGDLMRQYWIPAMLSSEISEPDSEPLRVMLLGEQLIGFRDASGRPGLISNLCPHRGASLFFGRNEESGIRCVYHGWKFDTGGNCVDMPNEPAESNFKSRVKANAYPCEERAGVVWAYMGPRETPPALPDLEASQLPDGEWSATIIQRECNWLQALEGDIDTSHLGFLHLGALEAEDLPTGSFDYYTVKDRAPRYVALDTPYGAMYGAYRAAEPGYLYWRVAQFLFPFYTHIPTGLLGREIRTRCWVPMDDTHTMYFMLSKRPTPSADGKAPSTPVRSAFLENTTDWFGRARYEANGRNDYEIDREGQRAKRSFTGLQTIHLQDQAVTESMGPVLNRSLEHLGSSDVMVIRVRMRLLEAALAFREKGIVPPGVENPEIYQVRSGGAFLPEGQDWLEGIADLLPANVEHPDLDPRLDARELRRISSKPTP